MRGAGQSIEWLRSWTWYRPLTWDRCPRGTATRAGGFAMRERRHDYARHPEPTLPAEVMRRGLLESA
jgi:hypothetical protein